jgi:hypothetical protein
VTTALHTARRKFGLSIDKRKPSGKTESWNPILDETGANLLDEAGDILLDEMCLAGSGEVGLMVSYRRFDLTADARE